MKKIIKILMGIYVWFANMWAIFALMFIFPFAQRGGMDGIFFVVVGPLLVIFAFLFALFGIAFLISLVINIFKIGFKATMVVFKEVFFETVALLSPKAHPFHFIQALVVIGISFWLVYSFISPLLS